MPSHTSSSSTSLDEALRAYVQESSLSQHPTPEEFEALRTKDILPEDAERLEEHLASCTECADQMLDLADFLEDGTEMPSEVEMERAWRRYQKNWKAPSIGRWPPLAIASTLAAIFFFTSLGLGIWGFSLQKALPTSGPVERIVVPSSTIRGSEDRVVIQLVQGWDVVLQLQPRTLEGPDVSSYRAIFIEAVGQKRYEVTSSRSHDPDILLRPPWQQFPEGVYRILLLAVGEEERPWDEFEFEILEK